MLMAQGVTIIQPASARYQDGREVSTGHQVNGQTAGHHGPKIIAPDAPVQAAPCNSPACATPAPAVSAPNYMHGWSDCNRCSGAMGCGDQRFFGRAEYLLWWQKGASLPPLATEGSGGRIGIVGDPTTTILYGDNKVGNDVRSGGRFTLGYWLDADRQHGIQGSYFFLGDDSDSFYVASDGQRTLGRPFINAISGANDVLLFSDPVTQTRGNLSITAQSDGLQGAEINYRTNVWANPCDRVDFLIGYRYLNLRESLTFRETIITTTPDKVCDITESFSTENNFHGLNLGLQGDFRVGNALLLEVVGKLAIGENSSTTNINAYQAVTSPLGNATYNAGLLAQSTNVGRYSDDQWVVVPELGVNLSYQVTCNVRVLAGYTILWWGDIARAGNQIDQRINPNIIPPNNGNASPYLPAGGVNTSSFWAQGVNLGLELRY
jgi:hypothetical protein